MLKSSGVCDGKAPVRGQTGRLSSIGNAASVRAGRLQGRQALPDVP